MKAVVFTLGCKVNGCESASLLRGLEERGYEVSDELVPADLYILNTCAVTAEAEKKSRQAIARIRAVSPAARILVCGCAAERMPSQFAGRADVQLVTGAMHKGGILELLDAEGVRVAPAEVRFEELPSPHFLQTRAFVKVQDGCNNFCSYCIIPYLRGRSRSRALESAAAEILSCPAEEVVVTGIDLSSYSDGGRDLADLLRAVKGAKARIRLGSLETHAVTEKLLAAAKEVRDFAPHFHLSLQSGSDAVLRSMNRKYTRAEFLQKAALVRGAFPGAAVTTDIIVGFPTETEEDFRATLSLAEEARFSQIHCFAYSRRTGTVAAKLPDLAPQVKKERLARLMALGRRLREEYEGGFVGRTLELVPEEERGGFTEGYSENYIRLYVRGSVGKRTCVRALERFRDGLLCTPEEE